MRRDHLELTKLNGPETQKLDMKKFLVVGEACMAIFSLTPGFIAITFDSFRFSTEGTLISVFAVPTALVETVSFRSVIYELLKNDKKLTQGNKLSNLLRNGALIIAA